jgi:hypothetical protein
LLLILLSFRLHGLHEMKIPLFFNVLIKQ